MGIEKESMNHPRVSILESSKIFLNITIIDKRELKLLQMKAKLVILDKNRCVFFCSGKSCSNLNSMTGTWQFLETNWQPVFMSENGSGPSNSGTSCKQSCFSRDSKQWVGLSTVGAILKKKRLIELLEKESLKLAKFQFKYV